MSNDDDFVSVSVDHSGRSTAASIVAGVGVVMMWGAIGAFTTASAITSSVNGFLVFILVLVGGCITAATL